VIAQYFFIITSGASNAVHATNPLTVNQNIFICNEHFGLKGEIET